jgi:hypothetical protein
LLATPSSGSRSGGTVAYAYFEPYAARVFQGFSEALRREAATGRCIWGDRVFFMQDGVERSIATVWPGGGPLWLRGGFRLAYSIGTPAVLFGTQHGISIQEYLEGLG